MPFYGDDMIWGWMGETGALPTIYMKELVSFLTAHIYPMRKVGMSICILINLLYEYLLHVQTWGRGGGGGSSSPRTILTRA